MRNYGAVHTTFWTSLTIRDMADDGKLLALYLLTSPHSNAIGCFRLPDGYATEDLNWPVERVTEGFRELSRKGWANRCETTKFVLISNYLEFNPAQNPNQITNLRQLAAQVPASAAIYSRLQEILNKHLSPDNQTRLPLEDKAKAGNGLPTVPQPYRNQDQDQDQDQDQKQAPDCAAQSAPPAAPLPAASPLVIELPLNDGTLYGIRQDSVATWVALYPAVDVPQQLRNMRGWLDANPKKRKTNRGIAAFVNTWLKREQDKSHPCAGRADAPLGRARNDRARSDRPRTEDAADIVSERLRRIRQNGGAVDKSAPGGAQISTLGGQHAS